MQTAVVQSLSFSEIKCNISELKGDDYKVWKERILIHKNSFQNTQQTTTQTRIKFRFQQTDYYEKLL